MQRPVMDLQYMREAEEAERAKKQPIDWGRFIRPLRAAGALAGRVLVKLCATPFRLRKRKTSPNIHLVIRGMLYRLMFLPILVTLIASLLVYLATHPRTYVGQLDPLSVGVYYDPVTVVAADGVRSEAWLAPAIDARKVVVDREKALHTRSPGVVLVHDMGQTARQMLPLVRPLHDAGYVVLVVGVRGSGTADVVGQTYGINESLDVRAALDMLRRRPYVDPQRIAVIGAGTGATAALLSRDQDPTITGLVLIDLPVEPIVPVTRSMTYNSPTLHWLAPICKWTFEVAYQVDLNDLDVSDTLEKLDPNATLQLQGVLSDGLAMKPERAKAMTDFLQHVLVKPTLSRAE
jgi:hypothetical protein